MAQLLSAKTCAANARGKTMAMVRKDGELGVMMAEAWQRGTVEMRTVQPEADSYYI